MFICFNQLIVKIKHMKCFEVEEKNQKVMEWDFSQNINNPDK